MAARAAATRWFGPAAGGIALVVAVVGGARWDGYSHRSDFISELGADGAPDGAAVSVGFVVIGLLLLASLPGFAARFGSVGRAAMVAVVLVVGSFGVSYAVSGVARCDPGCDDDAPVSTSQRVHEAVGAVGYTGATVGLAAFGWSRRRDARRDLPTAAALAAAPLVALLSLLMGAAVAEDSRGLQQRIVEGAVFGWITVAAVAALPPVAADRSPAEAAAL